MMISSKVFIWICKVSAIIRNNWLGKKAYDFLDAIGIRIVITRFYNWRFVHYNERHPNTQMANSRRYFKENVDRVKRVLELLEDQKSKEVYESMIQFRCNSVYSQLPYNSIRTQYFINDFFRYGSPEVLIDCGAYTGDTITSFKRYMRKIGGGYRVIAFEPDEKNYRCLKKNHPDVIAMQAGVWSETGELLFEGNGTSAFTCIDNEEIKKADFQNENTAVKVPVRSIDHIDECRNATFIKMDIEGSEYNALLGARHVICKNKPKLAICIYHSDEDMIRIIELIHDMVPQYHFYIRQHSNCIYETVLYATL